MARPISDEELRLKKRARRRLVGAIVLVAAVAVVLPMVLDSEPKPVDHNVDIQIPSPDSGEFKPKAGAPAQASTPIKGLPEGRKTEPPAPPSETAIPPRAAEAAREPASAAAAKPDGAAARASAVQAKESAPAAASEKKADKEAPAASGGAYVVQVAAFADVAKAKQLQKQVSGAGLKTYTEVVATKSGEVTRVRVGPYPTREAAEKARTQLRKAGLDGQVMPK
jgi:DedD protein